jgi:hypothetical protein
VAVAELTSPMITRSASGGLVQQLATPPVAPTRASTIRGSISLTPQGLPPPVSAVLSSCPAPPSPHSAKKRARPDRDDHGGAAAKVQTQQQPIEKRGVVGPAPPHGLWARRSGPVATEDTSKNQGNSAPAVVQVYKHTCYTLVH